MNVMNKLTRKHMMGNKKRTLVTIIGVIISVAMITAVSTGVSTFMDLFQRNEIMDKGEWHVKYTGVSGQDISVISNDKNTKKSFTIKEIGFSLLDGSKNKSKPYLYTSAYSKEAFEGMLIKVKEGRLPKNDTEVIISEQIAKNAEVKIKIGDTLNINLGERKDKEMGDDVVYGEDNTYRPNETFELIGVTKSYRVVGVMSSTTDQLYYSASYPVITLLSDKQITNESNLTSYVFENKVNKNIYDSAVSLAKKAGLTEEDVEYNERLLRFYGVTKSDSFNVMVKGLGLILILIIMVGSISLIYNSFAISTSERNKQFGMLSSVGATKKQKRNAVLYEAGVIAVISIPIGIIAGVVGMKVTFALVNPFIQDSLDTTLALRTIISYHTLIVATIFSLLTILISAYIPAKRASKITAIEAIRQTHDIKLTKKAVKTSKLTKFIFGIEGEFAMKNLKRNKKRYRALVFSLFISVVLFISVGSYVHYLSAGYMGTSDRKYDISISNIKSETSGQVLEQFKKLDKIKDVSKITYHNEDIFLGKEQTKQLITPSYKKQVEEIYSEKEDVDNFECSLSIQVLDADSFNKYLKEIGCNDTQLEGKLPKGILVNLKQEANNLSMKQVVPFHIKAGERLDLRREFYNSDIEVNEDVTVIDQLQAEVGFVTEKLPLGLDYGYLYDGIRFIMSEEAYAKLEAQITSGVLTKANDRFVINVKEDSNIDKKLSVILEEVGQNSNYYLYNVIEEARKSRQMVFVFSVFAYGFIGLISLICMANLCNTISTSYSLRRREYAMLKSVGMTPKSFKKMILLESLLYGIKALLYGIPTSLVITNLIRRTISRNFALNYVFPWSVYGVAVVAVFLVVGVAMAYSSNKIRKENIIEGLKML